MQAGPLSQIVIQGTSLCNLNCDYCYLAPEARKQNKIMSSETARIVFEKVFSSSITDNCAGFDINWHAGEPLTLPISYYSDMFSLIREIQAQFGKEHLKVTHSIQTNATLIDEQWCEFFKTHNIEPGVSLDGPDFIHDAHRKDWQNKGSHAKTMKGVKTLQAHGINFSVLAVITKDVLDYPQSWYQFFQEQNIERVGILTEQVIAVNQTSSMSGDDVLERYRVFLNEIWQLQKQNERPFKFREFENIAKKMFNPMPNPGESYEVPLQVITINSEGQFSTSAPELHTMNSEHYGDFIVGNLLTDTFESVLETEKFKRISADIQAGVKMCHETCDYASLCGGIWVSDKYSENGSFSSTETMTCRLRFKTLLDVIMDDMEAELAKSA